MTAAEMPTFRYHPDPVATGAIGEHRITCRCCGRPSRWAYLVPAYGVEDLRDSLCPWCIADGSAAARFRAVFTQISTSSTDGIDRAVLDQIACRTPGFSGWQQERWLFHCGDGCAFLGAVGWEEVKSYPDAVETLRVEVAGWGFPSELVDDVLFDLDVDGEPTAYLFACLRCGRHLAYADIG